MTKNFIFCSFVGEWRWGSKVCKFWLATDYTASTASIFNLVVLTLDRYWSVMAPLRYLRKRTRRRATLLMCLAWLAALSWLLPILAWNHLTNSEQSTHQISECETDFAHNIAFKLVTSALNFYLPSSLIVVLYYRIFRTIKKRTSTFPSSRQHRVLGTTTSTSSEDQTDRIKPKNSNDFDKSRKKSSSSRNGDICIETQMYKALTIIGPGDRSIMTASFDNVTVQVEYMTDRSYHMHHRACYASDSRFHTASNTLHTTRNNYRKITQPIRSLTGQRNHHFTNKARSKPSNHNNGNNNCRKNHNNVNLLKDRKAARQLGVIMGTFLACWVPYFTIFPVIAFCSSCVPQSAHMATISLGYLNSALNPIIYPLCNHHFRRAFQRMLKCRKNQNNVMELNTTFALPPHTH